MPLGCRNEASSRRNERLRDMIFRFYQTLGSPKYVAFAPKSQKISKYVKKEPQVLNKAYLFKSSEKIGKNSS